jgi:hypothetical protein
LRIAANYGLLLLAVAASPSSFAAQTIFCCHDQSGRQVCGDILPSACYARAYRELGDSGRTARAVAAPLTAEQRAQRAADEQRRKEQERALNEQKRKDQALLNTYGSPKDIEVMRSRAERDLAAAIRASEEKIGEILKQRKRFEDEAEFYRNRPLPVEVVKGLRDADNEIKSQESVIESKKKDQEAIRLKYDEDLRRFLELSQRAPARP